MSFIRAIQSLGLHRWQRQLPHAGWLLAACASAATPDQIVHLAVARISPTMNVEAVQDSLVPGFYEAIADGQFVYVSKDGRYLLAGSAFDVVNKRDLAEDSHASARKARLATIGPDKRIVFAPDTPVAPGHTVTVFTDVDCPFCRRFHEQIAQYNANGIAVEYLFYPLSIHPGADKKAQAVWCANDRKLAFTAAITGAEPGPATCANPIVELTQAAQSLGITGTPSVLGPDGRQINSQIAMSPELLAAELDRLAQAQSATHRELP